jgi:arsenate reductase
MRNRVEAFISLPLASIDQMALAARLKGIGTMDGSTLRAPQVA